MLLTIQKYIQYLALFIVIGYIGYLAPKSDLLKEVIGIDEIPVEGINYKKIGYMDQYKEGEVNYYFSLSCVDCYSIIPVLENMTARSNGVNKLNIVHITNSPATLKNAGIYYSMTQNLIPQASVNIVFAAYQLGKIKSISSVEQIIRSSSGDRVAAAFTGSIRDSKLPELLSDVAELNKEAEVYKPYQFLVSGKYLIDGTNYNNDQDIVDLIEFLIRFDP